MRVSLFVTCLVDQFCPEVALGVVTVLDRLGVASDFPAGQTCCGQPAFNSGCVDEARRVGRQFLRAFRDAEVIVAPSGSCLEMAQRYLPSLFPPGSGERADAEAIAGRLHEFSSFLVDVLKVTDVGARFPHRVTYHDSCHLLRGLGVREQPRRLLAAVHDLECVPLAASDTCCGFGGTFAVKYPDISEAMGQDKLGNLARTGAEYLVAGDISCLLHLRGMLARQAFPAGALHLAELLAKE
jgi:L-lactate dehydrogenase complex protein LldE